MPDTLNTRIGFQPEGPCYMPDASNNREGPKAREPSECLITNFQRLENGFDRAITSTAEAVCMPAHLALPGFP